MKNYKYAKIAYEAYCRSRQWKSVRGEPLPQFYEKSTKLQDAWWEAARAVEKEISIETGRG